MKEFKYFNLNTAQRQVISERITSALQQRPEVIFAYLYGSFINPNTSFRDVDVALYIDSLSPELEDPLAYESEVARELRKKAVRLPLEVKVINQAPFGFLHHIFARGELLFCRDEELLTDLIERTSRRHFEALPFTKSYLKELIS